MSQLRKSAFSFALLASILLLALACGGGGESSAKNVTLRFKGKVGDELVAYDMGGTVIQPGTSLANAAYDPTTELSPMVLTQGSDYRIRLRRGGLEYMETVLTAAQLEAGTTSYVDLGEMNGLTTLLTWQAVESIREGGSLASFIAANLGSAVSNFSGLDMDESIALGLGTKLKVMANLTAMSIARVSESIRTGTGLTQNDWNEVAVAIVQYAAQSSSSSISTSYSKSETLAGLLNDSSSRFAYRDYPDVTHAYISGGMEIAEFLKLVQDNSVANFLYLLNKSGAIAVSSLISSGNSALEANDMRKAYEQFRAAGLASETPDATLAAALVASGMVPSFIPIVSTSNQEATFLSAVSRLMALPLRKDMGIAPFMSKAHISTLVTDFGNVEFDDSAWDVLVNVDANGVKIPSLAEYNAAQRDTIEGEVLGAISELQSLSGITSSGITGTTLFPYTITRAMQGYTAVSDQMIDATDVKGVLAGLYALLAELKYWRALNMEISGRTGSGDEVKTWLLAIDGNTYNHLDDQDLIADMNTNPSFLAINSPSLMQDVATCLSFSLLYSKALINDLKSDRTDEVFRCSYLFSNLNDYDKDNGGIYTDTEVDGVLTFLDDLRYSLTAPTVVDPSVFGGGVVADTLDLSKLFTKNPRELFEDATGTVVADEFGEIDTNEAEEKSFKESLLSNDTDLFSLGGNTIESDLDAFMDQIDVFVSGSPAISFYTSKAGILSIDFYGQQPDDYRIIYGGGGSTRITGGSVVVERSYSDPTVKRVSILSSGSLAYTTALNLSSQGISSIDLSGAVNLQYVNLSNNGLNATAVNKVLSDIVNSNVHNGYLNIQGNDAPSGSGVTAMTTLTDTLGWTVLIDGV
ncbi:MAG: hypothetical protein HQL31_03075 [Planctomycetes bacterium]|nr:hypothetical protein [Planctomycetota bacterium]